MHDRGLDASPAARRKGVAALFLAYLIWGGLPLYWQTLAHVPAVEILTFRTISGLPFAFLVVLLTGRTGELRAAYRSRTNLVGIGGSAVFHLLCWGVYIWGVNNGRILEVGLGQYIVPLVSMLAGFLLFREHLSRLQCAAVAIAVSGVSLMALRYGVFPWFSLGYAVISVWSALFRKMAPVGAISGMCMELTMSAPIALFAYLYLQDWNVAALFAYDSGTMLLLIGAGIVTVVPQLIYTYGLQRTTMITLGFMQYTLPTWIVLVGVFLCGEVISPANRMGFICIWAALALYTADMLLHLRRPVNPIKHQGDPSSD